MAGFIDALTSQAQAAGYSPAAIAAMLGSAQGESSFNTGAIGDHGTSYGAMQWRGPRRQALSDFAAQQGAQVGDPNIQAKFLLNELNGSEKGAGDKLRAAQDPESALEAMMGYERPQGWSQGNPRNGDNWAGRLKATMGFMDPNYKGQEPANSADLPMQGAEATSGQMDPGVLSNQTQAGGLGALFGGNGHEWSLSDALLGSGMALMARDNPAGAAALGKILDNKTANQNMRFTAQLQARQLAQDAQYRQKYLQMQQRGQQYDQTRQDKQDQERIKNTTASDAQGKTYQANDQATSDVLASMDDADGILRDIKSGLLKPDIVNQGLAKVKEAFGESSPEALALDRLTNFKTRAANLRLMAQKGVQTDADFLRAAQEFSPNLASFDPKATFQSIRHLREGMARQADVTLRANESVSKNFTRSFDPEHDKGLRSAYTASQQGYTDQGKDFDSYLSGTGPAPAAPAPSAVVPGYQDFLKKRYGK